MRRKSRGRFFLSSAEVFAFFALSLFALLGTFDLARGLHQYVVLNRVAEAGASYASLIPGLEKGSFLADVSTNPQHHAQLQSELVDVLQKLGFEIDKTTISTENMNNNSIRIQISTVFTPKFGLFNPIPISVSFSGPYRKGRGVEV